MASSSSEATSIDGGQIIKEVSQVSELSLSIKDVFAGNSEAIAKVVANTDNYKCFIVTGKKLKEKLREKSGGKSRVKVFGLTIRMFNEANKSEFTFSRVCACLMISYYEKSKKKAEKGLADFVIPSLAVGLPDYDNETIRGMMLLAGPGAHFLVKYFFEKDEDKSDARVGYMMLICMLLDWASYKRTIPSGNAKLYEFMKSSMYDEYKSSFTNMLRNMGEKTKEISETQMGNIKEYIMRDEVLILKTSATVRIQTMLDKIMK